jgi:pilus assembly protein CpaC
MSRSFLSLARRVCELLIAVAFLTLPLSLNFPADAQAPQSVEHLVIPLHKSITLPVPRAFSSAVVGSPDVADALPMTDRTLYIQGKSFGTTNVSIYDENMRLIKVVDVEVTLDTGNLQSKIRATAGGAGIRVTSDNGAIILSGTASDAVAAERAVSVATAWVVTGAIGTSGAGGGATGPGIVRVVNAMTIASPQQVMLKVRFLEVSRDAGRELGVNWAAINGSGTRGVTLGQGGLTTQPPNLGSSAQSQTTTTTTGGTTTTSTTTTCPPSGTCAPAGSGIFQALGTFAGATGSPFGVILAEIVNKGVQIDTLVTALETKGLLQRLAEPNLVALSGDTASFLAGGSIPVPSVQSSSGTTPVITTQYQPYGVQLNFRPTVLNNGIINLSISPTVSELDYTNAVTIAGTTIPGLTQRSATTTVELRDGQSFAIAGMLQANNARNVSQLPWLGSVPVLGALFRDSAYQKNETDLVIIVTPAFVQPAAPGARLATPFDNTVPSNDVDFFLMGQTEQRKKYTDYVATGGDVQGPYGYMLGVMQGPDASDVHK